MCASGYVSGCLTRGLAGCLSLGLEEVVALVGLVEDEEVYIPP